MLSTLLAFAIAGQTAAPTTEVPFRTLAFGKSGEIKDGGAFVMRTQKELDAYRTKMKMRDTKPVSVVWGKEQVVALHAQGTSYGPVSLQVVKVTMAPDGSLTVEMAVQSGNMPAMPTPGVVRLPRKQGLFSLIAVPRARGAVTPKLVDPPSSSGDKSDTPGSR